MKYKIITKVSNEKENPPDGKRMLAPVFSVICFIVGHKIVGRECVRCRSKFGVPKMENCPPPPPKKIISSSVEEGGDSAFSELVL